MKVSVRLTKDGDMWVSAKSLADVMGMTGASLEDVLPVLEASSRAYRMGLINKDYVLKITESEEPGISATPTIDMSIGEEQPNV